MLYFRLVTLHHTIGKLKMFIIKNGKDGMGYVQFPKICLLGTDFGGGWVSGGGLDSCCNRKERYHDRFKRIFTNAMLVIDISNIIIVKLSAECNYICTWNPTTSIFEGQPPKTRPNFQSKLNIHQNWSLSDWSLPGPLKRSKRTDVVNHQQRELPEIRRRLLKTEGSYETTWPWAPLRIPSTYIFSRVFSGKIWFSCRKICRSSHGSVMGPIWPKEPRGCSLDHDLSSQTFHCTLPASAWLRALDSQQLVVSLPPTGLGRQGELGVMTADCRGEPTYSMI